MSDWRAKAAELLPELAREAGEAASPMAFWVEVWLAFVRAYGSEPRDEGLIGRVYAFADWCAAQPRRAEDPARDDLFTCAAVAFYEDLQAHLAARADMPRYLTRRQVEGGRRVFGYGLSDAEFARLLELFPPEHKGGRRKRNGSRRGKGKQAR